MQGAEASGLTARLLSEIFDAVDDIVYVLDEDGGAYLWNDQLEETTGYTTEEIAGMEPRKFLRPDDQEHAPGFGAAIESLGDSRIVLDIVTKDGETIPHEFRGTTFESPDTGEVYRCGIARDVSDRLARDRELERYETIIESVGDGVYVLDEDMRFSFVNDALCEMLGRSREELLGTDARDFFADEDERAAADEVREEAIAGDLTPRTVSGSVTTPDGREVDLESRYMLLREPEDGEFPGSAGVIRDVTERNRREEELSRQRALLHGILNAVPDVIFAFDEAGDPVAEEFMLDEVAGYSAEELTEKSPLELVPPEERGTFGELIAEVIDTGAVVSRESALVAKDGTRIPYEFRATRLTDEDGEVLGIVGSGRDVTERVERERALEQRRDELETLNRINELLLATTRELVETSSRDAVERSVCERLADSDFYRFAWIGERSVGADRLVPRVSAGDHDGYLEDVTGTDDESSVGPGPDELALETGEVQVVNVDDEAVAPWHEAAVERDIESIAAVPLRQGRTVYGVLMVYATRPDAFSRREQAGFRVLGETVGFVIGALKRRDLLFADSVVELEFGLAGDESSFARLSDDLDCTLSLDGYVAVGDDWLLYLDVEGADPGDVVERFSEEAAVASARVVADEGDRKRVEVTFGESALLDAAADVGATIRSASVEAGDGRIALELPGTADVREVVDLVTDAVPGSTLLARHDRDGSPQAPGTPGGLVDRLTERQRQAVTVAFRAGYFDWPRQSTAEEVADALDIAPATLHGHLRKAQGSLLASLLDERRRQEN